MNGFNPKLPNLTCVIATVINIEMNEIDIVEIKIVSSLALKVLYAYYYITWLYVNYDFYIH